LPDRKDVDRGDDQWSGGCFDPRLVTWVSGGTPHAGGVPEISRWSAPKARHHRDGWVEDSTPAGVPENVRDPSGVEP